MTSRKTWLSVLAGVVLGAVAIGAAPSIATADDAACGSKDNPCPLQKWMRANLGAPSAGGDTAGLAKGFDKLATTSPDPTWSTWSTIAKQGSDAAKKGDLVGAKAACKACHDAYKDKYKAQYRTRPAP